MGWRGRRQGASLGVVVVDDTGTVKLSRKLVNDEQPIRALVAEIGAMAERVSWAVDLTTVYASLLLTVLADAGKSGAVPGWPCGVAGLGDLPRWRSQDRRQGRRE